MHKNLRTHREIHKLCHKLLEWSLWSSWCQSFERRHQWDHLKIYTFSFTTGQNWNSFSPFPKSSAVFIFQSEPFPLWDPRADTAWVLLQSVMVSLSKCVFPTNVLLREIHWSSINMMNAKQKGRRWSAERKRARGSWKTLCETEEAEKEPGGDLFNVWA